MNHLIKPNLWNETTRNEKDRQLCEVVGFLAKIADDKYGSPDVKRLRTDFTAGRFVFRFDPQGRKSMEALLVFENEFLAAYILEADGIAGSFHRSHRTEFPTLDREDYTQRASIALLNAVLNYNGSSCFSTYLHHAVRREMIDFIRSNEERAGIGRGLKKLRKIVSRIMRQQHVNFDDAVEIARKEHTISDATKGDLADAIYRTIRLGDHDREERLDEEAPEEIELVRQALAEADLTDMERDLIVAHMAGDRNFRKNIIEANKPRSNQPLHTNPSTGRRWTRAALSLCFKRGCAKVKEVMESKGIVEAA